jgi:cell division protein ZapA
MSEATGKESKASKEPVTIAVRILDRDYHIACPPDEKDSLLQSAELLNSKLRETRDGGKVSGAERVAVMAALNLAHELLQLRARGGSPQTGARIKSMRQRVESVLRQRPTS